MQPLDLNTIIAQINQLSISGNASIQNKDSIIEFSSLNDKKHLYYAVEDLKTGKIINVNGDPISGYRNESYYINDLILEIRTYYSDNKLRSVSHIHIDRLHENYVPLGYSADIRYPIGISEIYNNVGKLTQTIDYDKILTFSYNDLIKFLKTKDKKIILNSISINLIEKNNGEINWDVRYTSSTEGLSLLTIDAKSGKVLNEHTHIQIIE